MEDCSASLLDPAGQLLAEGGGSADPAQHVGICLEDHLETDFSAGGEVGARRRGHDNEPLCRRRLAGGDPYQRLPRVLPLLLRGQLVAFNRSDGPPHGHRRHEHGQSRWGTEIFQEGPARSPLKIVAAGKTGQQRPGVILRNTRTPEMLENDLLAQISRRAGRGR